MITRNIPKGFPPLVIPAKAGTQAPEAIVQNIFYIFLIIEHWALNTKNMGSCFRRNDECGVKMGGNKNGRRQSCRLKWSDFLNSHEFFGMQSIMVIKKKGRNLISYLTHLSSNLRI